MLEDSDFAVVSGSYPGPTDLIQEGTWKSIISLPDDVSIRTSDKYGPQLEQMWAGGPSYREAKGGAFDFFHHKRALRTVIDI